MLLLLLRPLYLLLVFMIIEDTVQVWDAILIFACSSELTTLVMETKKLTTATRL
jgi:hypothetical protein